ncbi:MAG: T9SS type A sorting domain-containing protein [Saprospiraceae bacterium]
MRSIIMAFAALLVPTIVLGTQFYVSSNGNSANTGSMASPWDLQTALNHPAAVKPGDTIWLRGGTYLGNPTLGPVSFISHLKGTSDKPIVVRQYPGERAILDGGNLPHPVVDPNDSYVMGILGNYTWYWGFEVTDSNLHSRADSLAGSRWRVRSLVMLGTGNKYINLIVHDTGNGLGPFSGCVDCEVYGSIIFYNGWSHLGVRGHGEGMYGQNVAPTKFIRDNIVFKQFDSGIILYGSSASSINNFHLEGNVVFSNGTINDDPNGWGFLIGKNSTASGPGNNFLIQENFLYNRFDYQRSNNMDMGYQSGLNNVNFRNNYSAGYWAVRNNLPVTGLSATGNSLIGGIYPVSAAQISADSNTILPSNPLPAQNAVFVRPNLYEAGRAHIVVYNWQNQSSIQVNLADAGLAEGENFEVFDVQDLFSSPVLSATYSTANPIVNLPMNLSSVTPVIGENVPRPAIHTDPYFNVFLVKKAETTTDVSLPTPALSFKHFFDSQSKQLTLQFPDQGSRHIWILDASGKRISEKSGSEFELTLDLSTLSAGVYVVSVMQNGKFSSKKLLIW